MSENQFSRREALGVAGALLAGCAVRAEPSASPEPAITGISVGDRLEPRRASAEVRWAPADELVNTLEFEEQARRVLRPELFEQIAGGDRDAFDRVTFRPRVNIPTLDLDLGTEIFGQTLFAPLVVGPIADLGRYHEQGEGGMVRGASEAYTVAIVSSRSSVPFARLADQAEGPLWFSVYAEQGAGEQARIAAEAGAAAIFITLPPAESSGGPSSPIDWRLLDSIRQGLAVPVVIKGIHSPAEADAAVDRGYQGIVVSSHGATPGTDSTAPLDLIAPIADAVAGRITVLADGGFRRGTDVAKGLALGAQAVLMGRPAAWALAAYGSDGVRALLQIMHEEIARNFGMIGVSTPAQLTRDHIRIHRFATA